MHACMVHKIAAAVAGGREPCIALHCKPALLLIQGLQLQASWPDTSEHRVSLISICDITQEIEHTTSELA